MSLKSSSPSLSHQVLLGCDGVFPGLHNLGHHEIGRKPFLHISRHFHFFTVHVGTHCLFNTIQKEKVFVMIRTLLTYRNKNVQCQYQGGFFKVIILCFHLHLLLTGQGCERQPRSTCFYFSL